MMREAEFLRDYLTYTARIVRKGEILISKLQQMLKMTLWEIDNIITDLRLEGGFQGRKTKPVSGIHIVYSGCGLQKGVLRVMMMFRTNKEVRLADEREFFETSRDGIQLTCTMEMETTIP